jgi:signal transduction histidine kinase
MATVKRIMDEHGGTIEVASEEGQGTTITLILPPPPPTAEADGESTGQFRIREEASL